MSRVALLVLLLVLPACGARTDTPVDGAAPSPSPSVAVPEDGAPRSPSPSVLAAQGPCDEPLLDGDVVADATGGGGGAADGPLYESVESLARSAGAVVLGRVAERVDGDASRPVHEVDVERVVAGDVAAPLLVDFALGDTAGERCAPVVPGRRVLLFLTGPPGGEQLRQPLGSHNNGVLTVDDDRALTHTWVPERLREIDAPRREPPADGGFPPPGLAFDLDAVLEVVEASTPANALPPLETSSTRQGDPDAPRP